MSMHRDPRTHTPALLQLCRQGVDLAQTSGASQAEVCAQWNHTVEAGVQQNDLDGLSETEETTLGVRVIVDGRPGFATANGSRSLSQAVEDAVAIARATAPDPWTGFVEGDGTLHAGDHVCPELVAWSSPEVVSRLMDAIRELRAQDSRLTIDTAALSVSRAARAIATSNGVAGTWADTHAHGNVFGMAIDGTEVGSFAYDGDAVSTLGELNAALSAAFTRFRIDAIGALAASAGESFRGTILLPPATASGLLLRHLLGGLNGSSIRRSRSPFADKLHQSIASPDLTVTEEGRGLPGHPLAPFDREGAPRHTRKIVEGGVMKSILLDQYEARAVGSETTGSAVGGPRSAPQPGAVAVSVAPGTTSAADLEAAQKCVVVTRFSGTTNAVTGDFSGVVKGGFLSVGGVRRPIHETTISGNVYEALQHITGISAERQLMYGQQLLPTVRVADVSITAG